jgi:uroporphyrinogen decarboxylase
MDHFERIDAAIRGEATDRTPLALWRHWPVDDQDPARLAAATVRWQRAYDFDLVKFMPTGTYSIEDWGARTTYVPTPNGTRTVTRLALQTADQWPKLTRLDPARDYLGRQIEALRLAAAELAGTAPILQTVFSPLTTARKLAGERVFTHLRCQPDALEAGLDIIADVTVRFALESIRAGAHGYFFATQCASWQLLSTDEYRRFGERWDRKVLDAIRGAARYTLIHAHGEDIMFDLVAAYPGEMLSWHDRRTAPTLAEAAKRTDKVLACGINETGTLVTGPAPAIAAEIADAIAQTGGRRLLLAPGCVCPIDTPEAHLRAAVEAVRS